MKIGVISDIHANLPALEAVLSELEEQDIDALVCTGDLVGVLGSPNDVVSLIREHAAYTVFGNHDTRVFPTRDWLPVSDYEAVEYEHTLDDLTEENYEWLTTLPGLVEAYDTVTIAHARPDAEAPEGGLEYDDPGVRPSEYISVASEVFTADGQILLLGHTHTQHAVNVGKFKGQHDALVLNPGSVGFPFEYDYDTETETPVGKASFAVVDTGSLDYELLSVTYDASAVFDHLGEYNLADDPEPQRYGSMRSSE